MSPDRNEPAPAQQDAAGHVQPLDHDGDGANSGAPDSPPTPYRDAAWTYRRAGWLGVLPIPHRTKQLRAAGWTGHNGAWPSAADITAWCDSDRHDEGGGNIALRLPPDVVGVDIDNYGDKHGAADLAAAVAQWGPLPDTWSSTARDDGKSGIRLFRVPEGLRWPGQVGPAIEIIQTAHRYAVVWPSMHPTGRVYRWYRPDGMASLAPPTVDELPELPDRWIVGLTGGELAEDVHIADMDTADVAGWLSRRPTGRPCRKIAAGLDALLEELRTGSAHESLRHVLQLVRYAEQGHVGLPGALTEARAAFLAEATNTARGGSTRSETEALSEWQRSLAGAVRRVEGNPSSSVEDSVDDPCASPFAGLIATAAPAPALPSSPAPAPDPPAPAAPLTPLQIRQQQAVSLDFPADETEVATTPNEHAESPTPLGELVPDAPETSTDRDDNERTSWWPRPLAKVLTGEQTDPEPEVLARADGRCLFYAGKVNGLLGESESGKTWILLGAVVQQLTAGNPVLYVDFEDTDSAVVARLLAMGADPDAILALFDYMAPDESLHLTAAGDLADVLERRSYGLIGLDGYNAAMTLLGLDLSSNTDATKFSQSLLRPLARTGAAVVTVDHVGKDKEARGKGAIGAQAKRAMVTGAAYTVDVLSPFGRGQTGKLRLTVDKDRPGHVRGFAENSRNAGIATLESGSNGSVNVRVDPPGTTPVTAGRPPWRPTAMMEKVSRLLSTTDGMLGQNQIEQAVGGKASTIRAALEQLVEGGYVSRHPGPRNSILHRYEKTYREVDDLVAATDGSDDE